MAPALYTVSGRKEDEIPFITKYLLKNRLGRLSKGAALLVSALASFGCTEFGAWDLISGFDATLAEARLPKKRLPIVLSPLAQTTELNEFPVLVRLEANFPYELCSPDGLDISFRAADGITPLAYELEAWNPGGQSIFWVKIPKLAASPTPTSIWLYFSATYPLDGSNAAEVWSNGYVAVWHGIVDMVAGLPSYRDSADGHHGRPVAAPPQIVAGPSLGPAVYFAGPSASIKIPDETGLRNLGPLSLEFWILDTDSDPAGIILSKGDLNLSKLNGRVPQLNVPFSTTPLSVSGPSLWAQGSWNGVALTWGGAPDSIVYFFEGGELRSQGAGNGIGTRVSDAGSDIVISEAPPADIQATFDEFRISRVARNPDWMRAQYLSQQGTNITLGVPEDVLYD